MYNSISIEKAFKFYSPFKKTLKITQHRKHESNNVTFYYSHVPQTKKNLTRDATLCCDHFFISKQNSIETLFPNFGLFQPKLNDDE